jgi:hypothetical protein
MPPCGRPGWRGRHLHPSFSAARAAEGADAPAERAESAEVLRLESPLGSPVQAGAARRGAGQWAPEPRAGGPGRHAANLESWRMPHAGGFGHEARAWGGAPDPCNPLALAAGLKARAGVPAVVPETLRASAERAG